MPWSRHNPQFNRDVLAEVMPFRGIDYVHDRDLGGFRHTTADSPNTGLTSAAFRGFADYMQTKRVPQGARGLIRMARRKPTAIMCAEGNPFRVAPPPRCRRPDAQRYPRAAHRRPPRQPRRTT